MRPRPAYATDAAIREFITAAINEDLGSGDHSTLASISPSETATARLLIKDNGILAGVELAEAIFRHFEPALQVTRLKDDGDPVSNGDVGLIVTGPARAILSTERIVLNCMQRMSGVATYTKRLSNLITGTKARLTDTRKTTPCFRLPEKWAVHIGGGTNHRFALYDMIMLKDNHVDLSGGIAKALARATKYRDALGSGLKIEIETRTPDEVRQALDAGGADTIMLDNMAIPDIEQCVKLIGNRAETEASGGITEATIRAVAETGVTYISVGALTHSVRSLDISLKVMR